MDETAHVEVPAEGRWFRRVHDTGRPHGGGRRRSRLGARAREGGEENQREHAHGQRVAQQARRARGLYRGCVADVLLVDDALQMDAFAALREGVLSSELLGDSPLGGTFTATRGFSITFHRARSDNVLARFPFVQPFLELACARVREVQRRPLFGGPPAPNACYLNVLVVPPGAAVGRHVDATLGPSNGSVTPEAVAVLYLDVPDDLRGGVLALWEDEAPVQQIEPRANRFVLFAGRLGHEVTAVAASRPRVSIVCEQYALSCMTFDRVASVRRGPAPTLHYRFERTNRVDLGALEPRGSPLLAIPIARCEFVQLPRSWPRRIKTALRCAPPITGVRDYQSRL